MFKAKLIDDQNHYHLRRKVLLYGLMPNIVVGIIGYYSDIPVLYVILMFIVIVIGLIIQHKTFKMYNATFGDKKIIIDNHGIRIESKKPEDDKIYPVATLNKITIKERYAIPENSTKDIFEEARGKQLKNYIAFKKGGQEIRCDFVVDSHYMLVQLNKIIKEWENQGLNINYIP